MANRHYITVAQEDGSDHSEVCRIVGEFGVFLKDFPGDDSKYQLVHVRTGHLIDHEGRNGNVSFIHECDAIALARHLMEEYSWDFDKPEDAPPAGKYIHYYMERFRNGDTKSKT